jgi:hypothetical protein
MMRFTSITRSLACFGLWGALVSSVLDESAFSEMWMEGTPTEKPATASSSPENARPSVGVEPWFASVDIDPAFSANSALDAQNTPAPDQRYGSSNTKGWYVNAIDWKECPVDLSFLNSQERPAGRHGRLKADRDQLVFEDGTPARFWGANLVAASLFLTPRESIAHQAHRISKLGFNLVRIHQHDADWAKPNIFVDNGRHDTRHLDSKSFDSIDWWIKCLEDEGIYIWLDLNWNRALTPGDGVTLGFDEIRRQKGYVWGFNYFNNEVRGLMQEFQDNFLNHVNPYTRTAYKNDLAVVGMQLTNENDVTFHFGNAFQANHNNPKHGEVFMKEARAFATQAGLPKDRVWKSWEPGPSKLFLNEIEHRFNRFMIDDLRTVGTRALVSTTSTWAENPLSSLPSLTEGDIVDVHSYGKAEALSKNLREEPNFLTWIGAAQVQGKPLAITEWNLNPTTEPDRFTTPLYMASIAALQGWDMPMVSIYSILPITADNGAENTAIERDPALGGIMPAAAMAFRRGHISPAKNTYCLTRSREQLFYQDLNPKTCATIRTLLEQSRLTIGIPAIKELPWLVPSDPSGATAITDPNHDYIPAGQSFVRSDTRELMHSLKYGIQTIDTPKTQAVSGWVGEKTLKLADCTIRVENAKAVVALTSLDDEPLSKSRKILVTTVARAITDRRFRPPFRSEPVVATVNLRSKAGALQLLAVGPSGKTTERVALQNGPEGFTAQLPTPRGTHWYILESDGPSNGSK